MTNKHTPVDLSALIQETIEAQSHNSSDYFAGLLQRCRIELRKNASLAQEVKLLREALREANKHLAEAMGWNWLDDEVRPPQEAFFEERLAHFKALIPTGDDT